MSELLELPASIREPIRRACLDATSPQTAFAFYTQYIQLSRTNEETRMIRRFLAKTDMFYLAVNVLKRTDMMHPWLYARCREFQRAPNGHIDLWARDHYKSTIITFLGIIFEIINNPEVTIGIFSHTRGIAKAFLRQIMQELENNNDLKDLFPDIFYEKPGSRAPKWSEEDGIVVKRRKNPKEATVEAWGLVDGQPTSKHFNLRVYDDVVTRESVNTPEQIKKTTECYQLSQNLGTADGRERMVGTRYHTLDTYGHIIKKKLLKTRVYPATWDGTVDSRKAVLLHPEVLEEKRQKMGSFVFACQMLQNPLADKTKGMKVADLKFWQPDLSGWKGMNTVLLVDPANAKKKNSDYTGMTVWGLASDRNYYIIDMVYDKLDLSERRQVLFELHKKYKPTVFYERYGKDVEITTLKEYMELPNVNYRFEIHELGGAMSKGDRITRLQPLMEEGRVYVPRSIIRVDWENTAQNVAQQFLDQLEAFPVGHDDLIDSASRICDENVMKLVSFPRPSTGTAVDKVQRQWKRERKRNAGAMAG